VSPDFRGRGRTDRKTESLLFDNPSKFNPSQSLTSIDDIQEHNPEPKVKKREKKNEKKSVKSVRNTIIGGIGLGRGNNNKTSFAEHAEEDIIEKEKLQKVNKQLKEALHSRVRMTFFVIFCFFLFF